MACIFILDVRMMQSMLYVMAEHQSRQACMPGDCITICASTDVKTMCCHGVPG